MRKEPGAAAGSPVPLTSTRTLSLAGLPALAVWALPVTLRYSARVGEVLAVVDGSSAVYPFQGNELYVRARVTASSSPANSAVAGDSERAWTQPVCFESSKVK